MTGRGFLQILLGILQWTIAILSVAGTLALFGWMIMMIFRKDKAK